MLIDWIIKMRIQYRFTSKKIRTDEDGEWINNIGEAYAKNIRIQWELTRSYI
jgi:hypothetical protein